ncbi:MAG: thiamine pyrophosphate-dependent enzyme [Candidatus Woesearchaeota archaeon]|nr:thiamine pyrophosphate-dependent enzyme [Candidatus Woesearchaeota archaeon]
MNLKELSLKENRFASGHRACAGCGFPQIINTVLKATDNVVASCATGCLEVTSTVYPHTAWKVPWIHSLFENAAATISGVETAYNVLKRKGKVKKDIKFVAFGGDGGTYDIGLQSLSGALERGHKFVYVLYDNEAYENTGVQRSSATPLGAATTTSPEGKVHHGKEQFKKDITKIMVAHNIPYVAQTTVAHWNDLYAKTEKAFNANGPAFLAVLQPCTLGWKFPGNMTMEIAKLAVESRFWPLYEVENGVYKLNYDPAKPIPVADYLKTQGRFAHLFKPENKEILEKIQKNVDEEWEKLLKLCGK